MTKSTGVGKGHHRWVAGSACIDCGYPMRPAYKKAAAAPGTRQHVGKGRCSRCYSVVKRYPKVEFTRLLIEQSGRCAACGDPMVGLREPVVDHCHETGEVRGLLCVRCNVAEGMLLGLPERATRLAAYMAANQRSELL